MNREARILKARRKELGLSQTDQWERDPGCNQISIHALIHTMNSLGHRANILSKNVKYAHHTIFSNHLHLSNRSTITVNNSTTHKDKLFYARFLCLHCSMNC